MTRLRLASTHLGAAIAGAIIGAVLVLGVDGLTRSPSPPDTVAPSSTDLDIVAPSFKEVKSRVLLVWSAFGLPTDLGRRLEKMPAVTHTTTVDAGLEWIASTRSSEGTQIERAPAGLGIPWELAVIDPASYARFVPASERELVASLQPGRVLLARTEASLLSAQTGMQVKLRGGRDLEVAGVVSDQATEGYEGLIAQPIPSEWARADVFVLVTLRRSSDRTTVERRIHRLVGLDHVIRIRAEGETPFLRYGDAVLPQMLIKKTFGEFASDPEPDGSLEPDPRWRRTAISTQRVPLLGKVTCHVALFPQLRAALQDVIDAGIAFTVNREQYGGCFSARFVDRDPGGRISHHSWGIAIDINVAENIPGTRPDQDRRLVEIFENHGFTWGGRWLRPDGMHFEWVRFP